MQTRGDTTRLQSRSDIWIAGDLEIGENRNGES